MHLIAQILLPLWTIILCSSSHLVLAEPAEYDKSFSFVVGTRTDATSNWDWQYSIEVPLNPNLASYGYLALAPSKEEVVVTEILTLPERAYSVPSNAKLSKDGRTLSITTRRKPNREGNIGNLWEVAAGDPEGPYSLTVLLDGIPAKTVHFTLVLLSRHSHDYDPVKAMVTLVEDKRRIDGYWQACFENPYLIPGEYQTLTFRNAMAQVDRLIARHHQYKENWAVCANGMQSKMANLESQLSKISLHTKKVVDQRASDAIALLQRSISRASNTSSELSKNVVALHAGLEQFFKELQLKRSMPSAELVAIPSSIQELERRIIKGSKQLNDSRVEDLELGYKLYPTTQLAARLDNARIMQTCSHAIAVFFETDSRTDIQRLQDSHRQLQLAMFQSYQFIKNADVINSYPEVDAHYRALITDLKEISDIFDAYTQFLKLDPIQTAAVSEKPEFIELLSQSVQQLEQAGTRIDQRLMLVDQLLARGGT